MGKGIVDNKHDCYYLCYNEGTNIYEYGFAPVGAYLANGLEVLECFDTFEELQQRGTELGYTINEIENGSS